MPPLAAMLSSLLNFNQLFRNVRTKRHSALLKSYSNIMAPVDEIWRAYESVWRELDSASIARGFILMHRIAVKVIAHKGTNTFLQTHDFHSGVRNSFADTPDGVKPEVTNIL